MTHKNNKLTEGKSIKFLVPNDLFAALRQLADERNISLSSLIRLIATDYVKRQKQL